MHVVEEDFDNIPQGSWPIDDVESDDGTWTFTPGVGDVSEPNMTHAYSQSWAIEQYGFGSTQFTFRPASTSTVQSEYLFSFWFRTDGEGTPSGYNDSAGEFQIVTNSKSFYLRFCHLGDDTRSLKIAQVSGGNDTCTNGSGVIYPNTWNKIEVAFTSSVARVRLNEGIWLQATNIDTNNQPLTRIQWNNTWSSDEHFYFDSFGEGSLEREISDSSTITLYKPCYAHSQEFPHNECGIVTWSATTSVDFMAYLAEDDVPASIDISLYRLDRFNTWQLEPSPNLSLTYTDSGTKFFNEQFALDVPVVSTSTYMTKVCIVPAGSTSFFGAGQCVTATWCNGYTDEECSQWLADRGIGGFTSTTTASSTGDIWTHLGCDDIGIFDVKQGVQCALVWALAPSEASVYKFNVLKNNMLTMYPIGYGTYIYNDFKSALTSTSTDYFDRDIDVHKLFGKSGGTTTIDFDALMVHSDMGEPIYRWVDYLLWLLFTGWLFMFATSREL